MSPRTTLQLQQIRETKKQVILDAALKVFATSGFKGATIHLIAKEAGIAKGLLYSYYKSKEELLEELILYGLNKAVSFMDEMPGGIPDSKESFALGVRAMVNLFVAESDFWRLYSMVLLQTNMAERFRSLIEAFLKQYLEVYLVYFRNKGSSNPFGEAMLFGAVLDGMMFDLLVAPGEYPVESVMEMVIEKFA
ncbi:MAG: TetR/AcrR family transcriptional regulator [Bacteroidota bacterium]|nr:TetR/AcrR family transcriptional regulator [Bacteroidota bacterium]